MLSKAKTSFIISLRRKKIRDQEGVYIIEGDKLVKEYILSGMPVVTLFAKKEWINSRGEELIDRVDEVIPVTFDEIRKISTLSTPHNALAIVKQQDILKPDVPSPTEYLLMLETIQDPGNLGTIIRAASWFGIKSIVCSSDSVDCYNSKVVQASMGGLIDVKVSYTDLAYYLKKAIEAGIPVFGTFPQGKGLFETKPPQGAIILFGNESQGISNILEGFVAERISIPRGTGASRGIDSLNVAMSAVIVMSHFAGRD